MRTTTRRALVLLAALGPVLLITLLAPAVSACPFCDGGPSGDNPVRDDIFDHTFWPRLAATLAPFPILGGIVAFIYFAPSRTRSEVPHADTGST